MPGRAYLFMPEGFCYHPDSREAPMQAEVLAIGSEILLGQIVDTNSAVIARYLAAIGLNLFYKTTVGDNLFRVTEALRQALSRSQVVLTTGGIGQPPMTSPGRPWPRRPIASWSSPRT
jgi:hypothetical protein